MVGVLWIWSGGVSSRRWRKTKSQELASYKQYPELCIFEIFFFFLSKKEWLYFISSFAYKFEPPTKPYEIAFPKAFLHFRYSSLRNAWFTTIHHLWKFAGKGLSQKSFCKMCFCLSDSPQPPSSSSFSLWHFCQLTDYNLIVIPASNVSH